MPQRVPRGFVKVRHYGLLAPRDRAARLTLARRLVLVEAVRSPTSRAEPVAVVAPAAEPCCPHCGSRRLVKRDLPSVEGTAAASPDTS